ncbi:MAG: enoyl-CoA hydratase/isomerase family protein [Blastocatellales bacterium]
MLIIEKRNGIRMLTLNRPEKRNSLHPDLIGCLSDALNEAAGDESVSVVVIGGAGKAFCAGLDLNHLISLDAEGKSEYMRSLFELFRQIYTLRQPVIASINGPAIAGGFDLAAFCDIRLASPQAGFAQTEVLLGITQIMYPLYKIIGLSRAKELAMTGDVIDAAEAYRIGLVNHLYQEEELAEKTLEMAEKLAARPREALFETKRLSRDLIDLGTSDAFDRMYKAIQIRLHSDEHKQEVQKYLERLKSKG